MADILRRLLWFFIVSSALVYAFMLLAGSALNAQAISASRMVVARDSLSQGVHNLSGIVLVRTSCAQLSVRSEQITEDTYMLKFKTWNEPTLAHCTDEDTPRSFHALVFAPSVGVHFLATLDGEPLALTVIPFVD